MLALGSAETPAPSRAIHESLEVLAQIREYGGVVHLQRTPSHCGVKGNEEADRLAKAGALKAQPDPPQSLHTAKRQIAAAIACRTKERLVAASAGKDWESLMAEDGQISQTLPRRMSVALFRMLTGHDYLQKHLNILGIVDSPMCPLCSQGEMDARHLMECAALEGVNGSTPEETACERYWAARRLMQSRTGVG
ncbi:hypothetical protein GE061_001796 [Apolygus lucorum]|uniref:RNase H type-1 domain-containing protein n=1 Tax=Apolygus lucorum TaxID=248454 RepID=A0A8S9X7A0_APOLU|nr:hypothetical protein GE061_001796 [Apolygus lucorum]